MRFIAIIVVVAIIALTVLIIHLVNKRGESKASQITALRAENRGLDKDLTEALDSLTRISNVTNDPEWDARTTLELIRANQSTRKEKELNA
jgi:hypothetical protein